MPAKLQAGLTRPAAGHIMSVCVVDSWMASLKDMKKIATAAAAVVMLVLLASLPVQADYFYYGVACDDFTYSNDYMWDALDGFPEWSSYTAATVTGADTWTTGTNIVLHDEASGQQIVSGIASFASYVGEDDVLIFHYMAHGGTGLTDSDADDGTVSGPADNDPHPNEYRPGGEPDVAYDSEPYAGEEFIGRVGYTYATDDQIAAAFADFELHTSATVLTIYDTCHAGGFVGGSEDMNASAPATNNGLYVMMTVPEQGIGIGISGAYPDYIGLLTLALVETAEGAKTIDEWFQAAVDYGAATTSYVSFYGVVKDYYWWPEDNALLSGTYIGVPQPTQHWEWEKTYLQLRPDSWSWLDADHDVFVFTPEPTTTVLLALGVLGIAAKLRRRKES